MTTGNSSTQQCRQEKVCSFLTNPGISHRQCTIFQYFQYLINYREELGSNTNVMPHSIKCIMNFGVGMHEW